MLPNLGPVWARYGRSLTRCAAAPWHVTCVGRDRRAAGGADLGHTLRAPGPQDAAEGRMPAVASGTPPARGLGQGPGASRSLPQAPSGPVALAGPVLRPWQVEDPPAASTYRTAEPVWMWSHARDIWLAGEVGSASDAAVQVRYALLDGGTATDTVRPEYVMHRDGAE